MRKSRKRPISSLIGLLLSVILMAAMLPLPTFAESGVEQVAQELEALNKKLTRDKFVIISEGSSVTVRKEGQSNQNVQLDDKVVRLTIPAGVTVKWGAKIEGTGSGYLIELSDQSKGALELLSDATLTNPNGEGLLIKGGTLDIKENVNITMQSSKENSAVICATGGKVMMSDGQVVVGQASTVSYGIRLAGGELTLTNAASVTTANNEGAACKVEGGTLELQNGKIITNANAPALEVTGGKVEIQGGEIQSHQGDAEHAISLSAGVVNISGGMIVPGNGKKAIAATGGSAYISGGSIKGDISGLDANYLKNSASGEAKAVYRVTLTDLPASSPITEILAPESYGITDVSTDADGRLYVYVPAGKTGFKMTVGGQSYVGKGTVAGNHNNSVQMQQGSVIPGEITVSEEPQEAIVAYGQDVTLSVTAIADNGSPITYQWYSATNESGDNPQALQGETNSTLTLRKPNASTCYYYCALKAEGCAEEKSKVVKVFVDKGDYNGQKTDKVVVKSKAATDNATYTLPTLPAGMSWKNDDIKVGGDTEALIKNDPAGDKPSIEGNTLTFKTTAQDAGKSATITISSEDGTNYNATKFVLTVETSDKTPVQLSGLTPKNITYNGEVHDGYIGTLTATENYDVSTLVHEYHGRNGTAHSHSVQKPKDAGDYTLKVLLPDTDTTHVLQQSYTIDFTIEKKPVHIKVNNFSINVGDPVPSEYTYVIEGQIEGEQAFKQSADEIKRKVTCAADGQTAGKFPITVDMTGLTYTKNYKAASPAFVAGELTVGAATPPPAPRPRYRISIDPQGEWDFGQTLLNGLVHGKEFVVKNTGNRTLRQLSASLSGEQAEYFELTKKELGPLSARRTQSFTVMPKSGLPVGEYRATLRIQGDHGIDKQVELRFKVVGSPLDGHRVWEKKTEVPLDKEWTIRFNRPFDKKYVTEENVFLCAAEDPQVKIPAAIRLSEDATKLYIQPKMPLSSKRSYLLVIQSLKGSNGKSLKENIAMPFETK